MATSRLLHGSTAARAGREGRALAPPTARVALGPARAARWLALATAAVVGACVLVTSLSIVLGSPSMYGVAPIFDLGREASVPAGYSALLLLAAALLLALAAWVERSREGRLWPYWVVLALGFAYLAVDELVAIHEKLNRPLQDLLGASRDTTTWVVAGALGALAAGAFFLPFLRAPPAWPAPSTSAAPSASRRPCWRWATAPGRRTTGSACPRPRSRRGARWPAWRCSSGRCWTTSAPPGRASS